MKSFLLNKVDTRLSSYEAYFFLANAEFCLLEKANPSYSDPQPGFCTRYRVLFFGLDVEPQSLVPRDWLMLMWRSVSICNKSLNSGT